MPQVGSIVIFPPERSSTSLMKSIVRRPEIESSVGPPACSVSVTGSWSATAASTSSCGASQAKPSPPASLPPPLSPALPAHPASIASAAPADTTEASLRANGRFLRPRRT